MKNMAGAFPASYQVSVCSGLSFYFLRFFNDFF